MNEELQEALAKMIESSMEVAQSTGEWALDKAPELIQQFLMWELYSNILAAILCVLFALPLIKILPPTIQAWVDCPDSSPFVAFSGGVYALASIIGGTIIFIGSTYNVIHILVAPEIYLIKYFL